ncbi:hypothetical protein [Streptomyces sp. NPDC048521]|uniref:hypothetical protein n=1 Tax=Streptomyces sp. NPDC048521 TaxID=3365566 RepID=UPI0037247A8D
MSRVWAYTVASVSRPVWLRQAVLVLDAWDVRRAFLGSRGKRTLFEVVPTRAVGIRDFSAFTGEEEFILLPDTI